MKIIPKLLLIFLIMVSFLGCQKENKDLAETIQSENNINCNSNDFEMYLFSDKKIYKTTEKIKIWATLKYIGNDDYIRIWHGEPYMIFSITNGKDFNVDGAVNYILKSTILAKNKLYHFDYQKSGSFDNDDPKADFWRDFYEEEDLLLPEDEYIITLQGGFSFSSDMQDKSNLICKLKIKVK